MGVQLVQNADGSLTLLEDSANVPVARFGGPPTRVGGANATNVNVPNYRGIITLVMRLQGPTDTAGGIAALANPFGTTVYILGGSQLAVTTQSAGASTISVGPAANATTLSASLFSGVSGAAVAQFNSVLVPTWSATQFMTASTASGASSGLVGFVAINLLIP
jgi:hypothetical protein